MAKSKCTPLEIAVYLQDGRLNSADGIIMLDALLYHAWFIKHAPHVLEGEGAENYAGYIGLPLKQLPGHRWAASRGIYEEIDRHIEYFNRRPDFFASDKIDSLDMKKGLISDGVGLYRAYRVPQVIRVLKYGKIIFFAVGHKEEIAEMLSLIPAVGKKRSIGYGRIRKIEIKDISEDYTTFHPKYGLMRPMPVEEGDQYDAPIMMYAVKPPYHKEKNMRMCYVPII